MGAAKLGVELLGGLAILLGASVLLVARFTVHFRTVLALLSSKRDRWPSQVRPPGYEIDLLYLAYLAALIIGGLVRCL